MNVVFLLCDTMTRDKLSPYHGGAGPYGHIATPNLDRLAARGVTFENHWINSAPCIPARRDLFSGRVEFPWRSWGPRESFDPHWPLDPPEPYRSMYLDDPSLAEHGLSGWYDRGGDPSWYTEEQIAWLNAQCAGKLTMVDRWIGELLDAMDRQGLWEDTLLIVTSDHGEFIGEHGQMSKGHGFSFPLFARIPLIVAGPGINQGQRCGALTSTVDLHATVLDALGLPPNPHAHGRSVLPPAMGEATPIRSDALYGWWGKGVYWTDGAMLTCKAPEADGPLYQYGTNLGEKYTGLKGEPFDRYAEAECGRFLPHTDRPVYRVPSDGMCYAGGGADFDAVFDVEADPGCQRNLWAEAPARREACLQRMSQAMRDLRAPREHFQRLGLPLHTDPKTPQGTPE